jgi:hypothetical protein
MSKLLWVRFIENYSRELAKEFDLVGLQVTSNKDGIVPAKNSSMEMRMVYITWGGGGGHTFSYMRKPYYQAREEHFIVT